MEQEDSTDEQSTPQALPDRIYEAQQRPGTA
jgi:hypothetical protein